MAVSVLFNEPKLLKLFKPVKTRYVATVVSVLFNEPKLLKYTLVMPLILIPTEFQCSSTSRNC